LEEQEENIIKDITREANRDLEAQQQTLTLYLKCADWTRVAQEKLNKIRSDAAKELKRINWQQEREYQRLFQDTDVED
jgi:hypothetical protein